MLLRRTGFVKPASGAVSPLIGVVGRVIECLMVGARFVIAAVAMATAREDGACRGVRGPGDNAA